MVKMSDVLTKLDPQIGPMATSNNDQDLAWTKIFEKEIDNLYQRVVVDKVPHASSSALAKRLITLKTIMVRVKAAKEEAEPANLSIATRFDERIVKIFQIVQNLSSGTNFLAVNVNSYLNAIDRLFDTLITKDGLNKLPLGELENEMLNLRLYEAAIKAHSSSIRGNTESEKTAGKVFILIMKVTAKIEELKARHSS